MIHRNVTVNEMANTLFGRKSGALQWHMESATWKLLVNAKLNLLTNHYELYNLDMDPSETTNLVEDEVDIFNAMLEEFEVF